MTARVATGVAVAAVTRRVNSAGGFATVLAKGDATAGAILMILSHKGIVDGVVERVIDGGGRYRWRSIFGADLPVMAEISRSIEKRRRIDPDLWIVELDIADAKRFADEMVLGD